LMKTVTTTIKNIEPTGERKNMRGRDSERRNRRAIQPQNLMNTTNIDK